jgi:hypothetical protein
MSLRLRIRIEPLGTM